MRRRHGATRRHARGPARIETRLYVLGQDSVAYRLAETLVAQLGADPITVESWEELEFAVRLRPLPVDTIVVDARLDGVPGQSLVERLSELQPQDPVVLLKVAEFETDDALPEQGIEVQVFAYAPRPLQVGQFELGYAQA